MKIKPINPIARAMFRLRKPKQVIPNKKKNYVPDIDDFDDAYIDMGTGEICSHKEIREEAEALREYYEALNAEAVVIPDDDIHPKDDPHDEMLPKPKPPKEK